MAIFNGTIGDDIYVGGNTGDRIFGEAGADQLSGGGGNDYIFAGSSSMALDTGTEIDTLAGDGGDDFLSAGYGDVISGGAGTDGLQLSLRVATAGITADFRNTVGSGSITIGTGTISSIETIHVLEASDFDDILYLSDAGTIYGFAGNDFIDARIRSTRIWGGTGNDTIYGSSGIFGEEGDDILYGGYQGTGGSPAYIVGGSGNDHIYGRGYNDVILGEDGDDYIDTSSADDSIDAGSGNDIIYAGSDRDFVAGGDGNDLIYGDQSLIGGGGAYSPINHADWIWGGDGEDIIYGGAHADSLWSGRQAPGPLDFINAGQDDDGLEYDQIFGEEGNDEISLGLGDDADGGTGIDTLFLSLSGATAGLTLSTAFFRVGGSSTLLGGSLRNFETLAYLRLSEFNDRLTVINLGNQLEVLAGSGDDVVKTGSSHVVVNGGSGNDRFISGIASDTIDGADGIDTIDYSIYTNGVNVSLGGNEGQVGSGADGDTLNNIENIIGSAFSDNLSGSNASNVISGGNGDDIIDGRDGDDSLVGGAGNDQLTGGAGNDRLDGQGGLDTLFGGLGDDVYLFDNFGDRAVEQANQGADTVLASAANVTLGANIENLTYTGSSDFRGTGNAFANNIVGGSGNDRLDGLAGADTMVGGLGNDTYIVDDIGDRVNERAGGGTDLVITSASFTLGVEVENLTLSGSTAINGTGNAAANILTGNGAANVLNGAFGNDTLIGGAGIDTLIGGAGSDVLTGGTAGDRFVFTTVNDIRGTGVSDLITDFSHGQGDRIDLSAIDASTKLAGDQAFAFIGTAAFGSVAGQLRFASAAGVTTVQGDVNGDGTADFSVQLTGTIALVAADFVL